MKNSIKLIFILFLGFFLSKEKAAVAQSVTFNYTGAIQTWTVPCGITSIAIQALGASGGYNGCAGHAGGLGAAMQGTFTVTPGEVLKILVGGQGQTSGGNSTPGGGGGSFVTDNSNNPLIVAGGGGGGGNDPGNYSNAPVTPSGLQGGGNCQSGSGGINGGGGGGGNDGGGGGGGGIKGNGGYGTGGCYSGSPGAGGNGGNGGNATGCSNYGYGGTGFTNGGAGGIANNGGAGGFGGGGAGSYAWNCGGGGGGGYSGGGGGGYDNGCLNQHTCGGGGGSYNSGTNQKNQGGFQTGNGQVIITWTPIPTLIYKYGNVISNVNCNGGNDGSASAKISGGVTPYTYSWAPSGGSMDTATGLSAGSYTITISDVCGDSLQGLVTITQPNALGVSAIATANLPCNGDNIGSTGSNVSGGTSPYTYSWSGGGGTNFGATGLSAGTYTLNVTDAHGCKGSATATVTQPATLNVTTNVTANVLCNGENDGSASSSVSGGTPPYKYLWSGDGSTMDSVIGLSAGTYILNITDAHGCITSGAAIITQPATISIVSNTTPDNGSCNGSASVTVSGGTTPYKYVWSPGGTSNSIKSLCKGTYCCKVTDKNGCTDSVCITIISGDGIPNIGNSTSVSIYPNPNTGYFNISGVTKGEVIELYNYMGEKLSSTVADNSNVMRIDMSERANGIYLVRIESNDGSLVTEKKIMKVR